MNVCGALKLASRQPGPAVIVTVLCDNGIKYLSKVFSNEWCGVRCALQPVDLTGISLCDVCSCHEILRAQRTRIGWRATRCRLWKTPVSSPIYERRHHYGHFVFISVHIDKTPIGTDIDAGTHTYSRCDCTRCDGSPPRRAPVSQSVPLGLGSGARGASRLHGGGRRVEEELHEVQLRQSKRHAYRVAVGVQTAGTRW
jgi:hypothetical protein